MMVRGNTATGHVSDSEAFRPDIEGLRALAVLPILIFHLEPLWMPGGFAGVDIFFVISGYLISKHILVRVENGDFRFGRFYLRRFRRIFPALAVTVAASLAAGWKILTPADLQALSASAIASLLGVANIYFFYSVDYFNASSLLHPLLHVWSLGVEEQFYLIWPALLVILAGRLARKRLPSILVGAFALSLLVTALVTNFDPSMAFYSTPFRVFEFLLGAIVYAVVERWKLSRAGTIAAGTMGLLMLAATFIGFTKNTPWPGISALLPCSGTALLLWVGQEQPWQTILARQELRFVGRISYSVYLAHWPLIVFYRYWTLVAPTPTALAVLFVASLVLGWLLYATVEQFFRISSRPRPVRTLWPRSLAGYAVRFAATRSQLLAAFMLMPVFAFAFAVAAIVTGGFPNRLNEGRIQQSADELTFAGDVCDSSRSRCAFGHPDGQQTVYLVGDSHALNLVYGLDRLFKAHGVRGVAFYDHGCLFVRGTTRYISGVVDRDCKRHVAEAYAAISTDRNPVILADSYDGYVKEIGEADAAAPFNGDGDSYVDWLYAHMRRSFETIRADKRPVIIFARSYSTGVDTSKCTALHGPDDDRCRPTSLTASLLQSAKIDNMIEMLRREFAGVTVIDPKRAFCGSDSCVVEQNGDLFFRDTVHLTNEGSAFLIDQVSAQLLMAIRHGDRDSTYADGSRPQLLPGVAPP